MEPYFSAELDRVQIRSHGIHSQAPCSLHCHKSWWRVHNMVYGIFKLTKRNFWESPPSKECKWLWRNHHCLLIPTLFSRPAPVLQPELCGSPWLWFLALVLVCLMVCLMAFLFKYSWSALGQSRGRLGTAACGLATRVGSVQAVQSGQPASHCKWPLEGS